MTTDDGTGAWNFVHGTAAGCTSIATYEGLHGLASGPILAVAYCAVTLVCVTLVRHHRKHLRDR